MKLQFLFVLLALSLVLTGCIPKTTQTPSVPVLSSTPNTEITTVTESTSATEYTEVTEATEPSQTTTPKPSFKEQLKSYSVSTDFVATVCWTKVLKDEAHSYIPSCSIFTEGKVEPTRYSLISEGFCSSTSTNSDCPVSYDEIITKYDADFFKTHFLFVAYVYSHTTPTLESILYGESQSFPSVFLLYNNDHAEGVLSEVYYIFIEVPRAHLDIIEDYMIMSTDEFKWYCR